ncbi:RDD family protein [Oceaniglobus trochenteri]|uniref:RDD family protein n=1 Tax=Oceaniglobus trochenteri TaxID=2763260 RepID=UPI001CFF69A0|nr:RDD family protein [Oceaniglobus trochenteri]
MSHADTQANWGLPDPDSQQAFYADVPSKRFFAWLIDIILITLLTLLTLPLTLFIGLFFLPLLFATLSFMYRVIALTNRSATPGMRLMAIEFRTARGERMDLGSAFMHTLCYFVSMAVFPLQLISIVLMLTTARAQGLTDHLMGTAAINRAAEERRF